MKVHELKNEMDRQFGEVRQQFGDVRQQFDDVRQQFGEMRQQFDDVRQQFSRVDERFTRVDERFAEVNQQLTELRAETARLAEDGAHTRRHFDVIAEQLRGEFSRLAADIVAAHERKARRLTGVEASGATMYAALDDHELRLRVLERRKRPT